MKNEKSFGEFMSEKRLLSRWDVVKISIFGGFLGVLLAVMFCIVALV